MGNALVESWRINNRVTVFLIENLPPEVTHGLWQWKRHAREIPAS